MFGLQRRANREERKKIEEEEEEGEAKKKVMESKDFYDYWYGFCMESKDLMVLYGFLAISMVFKSRV